MQKPAKSTSVKYVMKIRNIITREEMFHYYYKEIILRQLFSETNVIFSKAKKKFHLT